MKVTTLFENTACCEDILHGHGLSIYIETGSHKILFDMGPDDGFLKNARKMGIDLSAVDTAVLSHGHSDHGGGLEAFYRQNPQAKIYIHRAAFGDYYSNHPGQGLEYIGLDQSLDLYRFNLTGDAHTIDEDLTLFGDVPVTYADVTALQKDFGFKPNTSLRQGLRNFAEWYATYYK